MKDSIARNGFKRVVDPRVNFQISTSVPAGISQFSTLTAMS